MNVLTSPNSIPPHLYFKPLYARAPTQRAFIYFLHPLSRAHLSLCPLLPREGQRSRAEGREERGRRSVWGRESSERKGGGVRQYHSSNIFRPWSEPLLVGIVWILSRIWHSLEERRGRGLSEELLPIRCFLTRESLAYLASPFIPVSRMRTDE